MPTGRTLQLLGLYMLKLNPGALIDSEISVSMFDAFGHHFQLQGRYDGIGDDSKPNRYFRRSFQSGVGSGLV